MTMEAKDHNNLINEVVSEMSSKLNKLLDDYMIEGLKLKGFEFDNRHYLIEFIKSHITCIDNTDLMEREYSVDGIPFFLHSYKIEYPTGNWFDKNYKIEANYGSFKYL